MLSHHNLVWTGESQLESFGWPREEMAGKRLVSYLPMAHIAERMVTHYGMIFFGYEVTTCPDPSQIATYAREVHPNIIFGVPRVWEKVYGGVQGALALDPEKKAQFDEAIAAASPIREKITWGTATDEELATYQFLDDVAFSTVRGPHRPRRVRPGGDRRGADHRRDDRAGSGPSACRWPRSTDCRRPPGP